MTSDIKEDCHWFMAILLEGHLQSVPVSIFADVEAPRFHFYSDACDSALVVLNPSTRQYIWLQFDDVEKEAILRIKMKTAARRLSRKLRVKSDQVNIPDTHDDFSINVREFFAVVLAMELWGPHMSQFSHITHCRAWIDNSAAVILVQQVS